MIIGLTTSFHDKKSTIAVKANEKIYDAIVCIFTAFINKFSFFQFRQWARPSQAIVADLWRPAKKSNSNANAGVRGPRHSSSGSSEAGS